MGGEVGGGVLGGGRGMNKGLVWEGVGIGVRGLGFIFMSRD